MAYVLCVKNESYETSLERRKVYRAGRDLKAEQHGLVRTSLHCCPPAGA